MTLRRRTARPAEGNFLVTATLGRQLVELVGSPHCRLHLDVQGDGERGEPMPDLIRRSAAMLAHFHANDPNLRGPGHGRHSTSCPILEPFGEIDYRGWVSVEVFDYTPGIEPSRHESIEYLQSCLREL